MTEKVMNDLEAKSKTFYDQNGQFETTYNSTFKIKGFKPKEIGEQLDEEVCRRFLRNFYNDSMLFSKKSKFTSIKTYYIRVV